MVRFLEKLNTPRAVIVVLVLFLGVDGFLFYRYQLIELPVTSFLRTSSHPYHRSS